MSSKPKNPIGLADLRAARMPLLEQRAQLEANTYGQDEARAGLVATLRSAAATVHERVGHQIASGNVADVLRVTVPPGGVLNLAPILCAILSPDVVAEALARHLETLPPSMPEQQRAEALADIAAELAELEEREEVEVCRLEDMGERPERRADADPAVVLKLRG